MSNKRGQMIGLGIIVGIFITVLVGVVLLQTAAQEVGTTINLVTVVNQTIAAPANGGVFNITTSRAISGLTVFNATAGGQLIGAGNYTIANNQVLNGALVVTLTVDDAEFASTNWNLSYTSQPLTYIPDSGSRALASLIIIMFALAIAVVSMTPMLRNGLMDMMNLK